MASTKDPKAEPKPVAAEIDALDDDESDGEEQIDLDEIEPTVLWNSLAQYTTEMLDDDEWVDPELLPVYAIVLSNLAQIVAQLTNEPLAAKADDEDDDDDEDEDDDDVS